MERQAVRSRRGEYSDATRQALLEAARAAFAEQGFARASAEAISQAARVTRGAFYHHFADKSALFDAVVVEMQREAVRAISERVLNRSDHWEVLETGLNAYLDACMAGDYARIVVREAPGVLGPDRFAAIEGAHMMALLQQNLLALQDGGKIMSNDIPLLTKLVDAMICELAVLASVGELTASKRSEGVALVLHFVRSLHSEKSSAYES
jgi:AcrR family transcriptional regulator